MTEDEARTKWCPHVRVGLIHSGRDGGALAGVSTGYNRMEIVETFNNGIYSDASERECRCIGSRCMAWRWDSIFDEASDKWEISDTAGYCGLAGMP